MKPVVISNMAWVPVKDLAGGPAALKQLEQSLTVRPRPTSRHNPHPDPIPCGILRGDRVGVPRQYFLSKQTGRFLTKDRTSKGLPVDLGPKIELFPDQVEPVFNLTAALKDDGKYGGILQAECGTGKTIMALETARRLGVTTGIFVHTEFLEGQWRKEIRTHFPDARVGYVRQDKCKFTGCDIVLLMTPSLVAREYPDELYKYFGLGIYDEVHRHSAPTWSRALPQFFMRWRVGLSATPTRKDKTEKIFHWHIGPVLVEAQADALPFEVVKKETGFRFPPPRYNNRGEAEFEPEKLGDQKLRQILAGSVKRNGLILADIIRCWKGGRKSIVFSERRDHLLKLARGLYNYDKAIKFDFFVGEWYSESPREAKKQRRKPRKRRRRQEELAIASKAPVIFATYKMAKESLNILDLDTMIQATPESDVHQATGRIRRRPPPGSRIEKQMPTVYDYRDSGHSRLEAMARSRDRTYKKLQEAMDGGASSNPWSPGNRQLRLGFSDGGARKKGVPRGRLRNSLARIKQTRG